MSVGLTRGPFLSDVVFPENRSFYRFICPLVVVPVPRASVAEVNWVKRLWRWVWKRRATTLARGRFTASPRIGGISKLMARGCWSFPRFWGYWGLGNISEVADDCVALYWSRGRTLVDGFKNLHAKGMGMEFSVIFDWRNVFHTAGVIERRAFGCGFSAASTTYLCQSRSFAFIGKRVERDRTLTSSTGGRPFSHRRRRRDLCSATADNATVAGQYRFFE